MDIYIWCKGEDIMQPKHLAKLNELIQQHFQHKERQLAIQLIISLDDINLRNLHFVDFMEEFAVGENGMSKNMPKLATLTTMQLSILEKCIYYMKMQCPTCYRKHIETGLLTIQHIRQHTQLVS